MNKSICIVTSANISYNPRALKEADALFEAGFDVRVVSVTHDEQRKVLDDDLIHVRKWRFDALDVRKIGVSRYRWLLAAVRQKFFTYVFALSGGRLGLVNTYSRYWTGLAQLASKEKADLYIAHNLPALPAAAKAAKLHGAMLGFDAEDFHRGEFHEIPQFAPIIALTKAVEEKYIPQCDYVTAASDGIGVAYASNLGIPKPQTILNVFPLSLRSGIVSKNELAKERREEGLSLYWYSQVIGPDRGLEDVLEAMAQVGPGVCFHLRGEWAAGYEAIFRKKARELGVENSVYHLPPVPPDELIERASMHDIGLALEPGDRQNNDIAASNKLFAYMSSGLAIIATNTKGQRTIMSRVVGVGDLVVTDKVREISEIIKRYMLSEAELNKAKKASLESSREIYSWDNERQKLVANLMKLLSTEG